MAEPRCYVSSRSHRATRLAHRIRPVESRTARPARLVVQRRGPVGPQDRHPARSGDAAHEMKQDGSTVCTCLKTPGAGRTAVQKYAVSRTGDRKSTRLNSSHVANSYDVFC